MTFLAQSKFAYAPTTILCNYDSSFNDPSKWIGIIPQWNDRPNECILRFFTSNSSTYHKVVDRDGWDWSDAVYWQGKRVHTSESYPPLAYEPIIYRSETAGQDYKLELWVQMKFCNRPTNTEGIWNPTRSYYPYVAGAFVMLFFEFRYKDNNGVYHWSDMSSQNPDYPPDYFVVEMSNRWYYNEGWYQAASSHPCFNYFTDTTTHDHDLHDLRAGWQWTEQEMNNKAWKTFYHNVGSRIQEAWGWFNNWCINVGQYYGIAYIDALRLKAVAISVETYCAIYDMNFCDLWVYYTDL